MKPVVLVGRKEKLPVGLCDSEMILYCDAGVTSVVGHLKGTKVVDQLAFGKFLSRRCWKRRRPRIDNTTDPIAAVKDPTYMWR